MRRKKWNTPRLVVLLRPHTEEAVLQVCKFRGFDGPQADSCILQVTGVPGENCLEHAPS